MRTSPYSPTLRELLSDALMPMARLERRTHSTLDIVMFLNIAYYLSSKETP